MKLPESKLTTKQVKALSKELHYYGDLATLNVKIRFDDNCKNGHNSFSITADVKVRGRLEESGCLHELIASEFPELIPFIKWHLCSTDGPMHYIANSLYHASDKDCWGKPGKVPNLKYARSSAIWPDATLADFTKDNLEKRLPGLMVEFKTAMESLGFTY